MAQWVMDHGPLRALDSPHRHGQLVGPRPHLALRLRPWSEGRLVFVHRGRLRFNTRYLYIRPLSGNAGRGGCVLISYGFIVCILVCLLLMVPCSCWFLSPYWYILLLMLLYVPSAAIRVRSLAQVYMRVGLFA